MGGTSRTGDLVKELDWKARGVTFAAKASASVMDQVTLNIVSLIGCP